MNRPFCQLFEGLSEIQFERLNTLMEERVVKKDEQVFREGQAAEQLYCIKRGAVEMMTSIDNHIELPITILRSEGSHFGTSSLIPPYIYSLSARSYEDSILMVIKRSRLMEQTKRDPEMGFIIMSNLAKTFLERLKETRQEVKIHFKTLFKVMQF
jgi:signal-transduction protein with cAMP-binding, CBS, and nucleotidyltransferase domain